jgi:hypothetical protein
MRDYLPDIGISRYFSANAMDTHHTQPNELQMPNTVPGDGKTFKVLEDGHILFRSPLFDETVVLESHQFRQLQAAVRRKIWVTQVAGMAPAIALVLGWLGHIGAITVAVVLLATVPLAWVSHAAMKRLHRRLIEQSPVSEEKLPGLSAADMRHLVLRNIPDRQLALVSWMSTGMFILALISLVLEQGAERVPAEGKGAIASLVLAAVAGGLFFLSWQERKRRLKGI